MKSKELRNILLPGGVKEIEAWIENSRFLRVRQLEREAPNNENTVHTVNDQMNAQAVYFSF